MQQFPPSISLNKDTIGQQGPACGPPKPPQTWQTTIVLTAENDDMLVDGSNSGGNWWRGQIEVGGDGDGLFVGSHKSPVEIKALK